MQPERKKEIPVDAGLSGRYDYAPLPALEKWVKSASASVLDAVCSQMNISRFMLWQWYVGRRGISADKAGSLVSAMTNAASHDAQAPRPLNRGQLCRACRECEHFQQALLMDFDDGK